VVAFYKYGGRLIETEPLAKLVSSADLSAKEGMEFNLHRIKIRLLKNT